MWGLGPTSPESVRELGSSVIMLLPPFPGRKRKRNPSPSNPRPNQKPVPTPHQLLPDPNGICRVLGTVVAGGVRGERADGQGPEERKREGGSVCV